MRTLSFGLIFLLASAICAHAQSSPVAVPNPGFEDGELLPTGWTVWASGPEDDFDKALRRPTEADFIWDRAEFRTGHRSLCIRSDGPRWATWQTSPPVAVRSNQSYRLSVWIKKRGGPSSTYLRVRNAGWTVCDAVNPGPDWARFVLEFKTAPTLERLNIELSDLGGNDTETWFDDVELVETPK